MPATSKHSTGSYLMPTLEHATVADAMHPGILSCEPDAPLTEVARMMAAHHVHCIAVVGSADEHPVLGTVSDLELVEAGLGPGAEQTAAALARRPIVSVEPATPLREAAELMLAHGSPHVLVIEPREQRPIGVLSTLDVAGVLAWGEL